MSFYINKVNGLEAAILSDADEDHVRVLVIPQSGIHPDGRYQTWRKSDMEKSDRKVK